MKEIIRKTSSTRTTWGCDALIHVALTSIMIVKAEELRKNLPHSHSLSIIILIGVLSIAIIQSYM